MNVILSILLRMLKNISIDQARGLAEAMVEFLEDAAVKTITQVDDKWVAWLKTQTAPEPFAALIDAIKTTVSPPDDPTYSVPSLEASYAAVPIEAHAALDRLVSTAEGLGMDPATIAMLVQLAVQILTAWINRKRG